MSILFFQSKLYLLKPCHSLVESETGKFSCRTVYRNKAQYLKIRKRNGLHKIETSGRIYKNRTESC